MRAIVSQLYRVSVFNPYCKGNDKKNNNKLYIYLFFANTLFHKTITNE